MGERQDYIALDWVTGEIGETLKQAVQALEAYTANRDDATKLRFCLTHIHQVYGTLQMVEFFGAALLAEEMEGLAHALIQGEIHDNHIDDALQVLQNSIVQLPLYLEKVKESHHVLPATLLPVLNDLRAVRGESLLSETVLFSPDMSDAMSALAPSDIQLNDSELIAVAHKLRQMFQVALLGLIRGNELKKNVNYLAKVCAQLAKLTMDYPLQSLWRVCIAVLEGMLNGSIEPSVAVKILLRQVDRQIKQIIDLGGASLQQLPPEDLLKNLLYYVARSKANSRFIQEIKSEFNLDASLLGEGELEDESLATPDSAVMQSVVEALGLELSDVKVSLAQAGTDSAALTEVLPLFRRVSDTMAILGMGSTLKEVKEPYTLLAKRLATQDAISTADMDEINQKIALAEAALNPAEVIDAQIDTDQPLFNDSEEAQQQLDSAFGAVLRESRHGLEQIKEAIIEFVATQWNHSCLSDVPKLLVEIHGSLNMVPLTQAAAIIQACEYYVSKDLLANKSVPEWQMLDTLADAITSIDYYLERLIDDANAEGCTILDVAAESVAELGYPPVLESESSVPDAGSIIDVPMLAEVIPFQSPELDTTPDEVDIPVLIEESAAEGDDENFDPEIAEIFIEEAGEVLEAIAECLPVWMANNDDEEASSAVRRAFHTLKGSGRMVGAMGIGELAWSVEDMLNHVLDDTVKIDQRRFDLIIEVQQFVPELVEAYGQRQAINNNLIEKLVTRAQLLSKEQNPVVDDAVEHVIDVELPILNNVDVELRDIFATEARVHCQILDSFITHSRQLAGPAELTDELQRALHTLKGSAKMAAVDPVAMIAVSVECLVRELRASQLKADQAVIDIMARGSMLINEGIEQLATTPLQMLAGSEDYIEQVRELIKERMALAASQDSENSGIPPEALSDFLIDSLDRITDISELLVRWQQGELDAPEIAGLEQLTNQLIDQAEAVNIFVAVELGQAVQRLYRRGASIALSQLGNDYFVLAGKANDTLIDLLDQIAGHQTPCFDQQLLTDIQDYEFADAASIDNIDDSLIELLEDEELLAGATIVELDLNAPIYLEPSEVIAEELPDAIDDREITAAMVELVEAIAEPVVELEDVELESVATSAEEEDDDELDAEIVEIFMEEADELLEAIDEAIHSWSNDRSNPAHLNELLRILHTLKGGARLAKITSLGDLSHNFETSLTGLEGRDSEVSEYELSNIQAYQDQLISVLAAIKAGETVASIEPAEEPPVATVVETVAEAPEVIDEALDEVIDEVVSEEPFDEIIDLEALGIDVSESPEEGIVEEVIVAETIIEDMQLEQSTAEAVEVDLPAEKSADIVPISIRQLREVSDVQVPSPVVDSVAKSGQQQEMVKVSAQLLEEMVNLAGETSISRGRAEEQMSDLVFSLDEMQITVDRLQEQVRRLDMETEQQILFRQEQVESEGMEGFDPLEMDRYSQLQQLSRSLLESASDLVDIKSTLSDKSRDMETLLVQQSRINTELQEGLMRSRMIPFSRMVPRLRRVIRQVSGELGKKVDFHLDNIEGELDRTVLEKMVTPLEHMLRNAVDHGIESADIREAAGKSTRGNIKLELMREGGEIVLTLSDDGAGIDLAAVKSKAIEQGLMASDADLTDHEVMQFILQAGFSTAAEVTQISGRGVGMDVVHSEIKQLGGSMDIDSVVGQGSRFIVRLPFTVSVNRALMVNVGGDTYAIPLNTIEGIVRVSPFELEAYYQPDAPKFEYAGQPYLLRYMGALLHRGDVPNLEGQSQPLPVVLVRGAEHSVAIQVDHLMGSREIVVKPLGPQFSMVQGLSGATVLGDGSVVVILDLLAMIRADASHMYRDYMANNATDGEVDDRPKLIMVVDDSVTVRKVTSRFLERQGMEVMLAKDGVDAVTQLQDIERIPDLMLLDIEMPRMDGFEVANRVRHNSRLENIPIIMITSRTGEKHRERALSLGVNDYMGKPYQESELLNAIHSLTGIMAES